MSRRPLANRTSTLIDELLETMLLPVSVGSRFTARGIGRCRDPFKRILPRTIGPRLYGNLVPDHGTPHQSPLFLRTHSVVLVDLLLLSPVPGSVYFSCTSLAVRDSQTFGFLM